MDKKAFLEIAKAYLGIEDVNALVDDASKLIHQLNSDLKGSETMQKITRPRYGYRILLDMPKNSRWGTINIEMYRQDTSDTQIPYEWTTDVTSIFFYGEVEVLASKENLDKAFSMVNGRLKYQDEVVTFDSAALDVIKSGHIRNVGDLQIWTSQCGMGFTSEECLKHFEEARK